MTAILIRMAVVEPIGFQRTLFLYLKDNFDIYSKALFLDATYKLYIRSKSTNRFVDLIRPGLRPPCFAYKI